MIETGLKAGDIFTWENYPLSMDVLKSRWFLYLGNRAMDAVVYQITTTTQLQHYAEGGNRAKHNHFKIPVGIGGLERESVLDLRMFEEIPESLINEHKADIEKKGSLNQDYANKFVNHLKRDRHILTVIKKDICRYLVEAGFKIKPI